MWPASPGSCSSLQLGVRTPAEIDGRARERVVHRHDGVAVPRDAAPVAERLVERLPERERRVLGRVVVAGLEIAGTLEHQVEAGVERELLEEVVVEPGAGLDAHARGAVEREPNREPRLGGGAQRRATRRPPADATGDGRSSRRASVSTSTSSSTGSSTDTRIASGIRAHDDALPQQQVAEREPVGDRDVEEVARATAAARGRARAGTTASRSRSSSTGETSGGEASAAIASAAESVETGAGAWRAFSSAATSRSRERVADARAGERERLRERPQHDHAVVEQRQRGLARVLEVRLVDDERPRVRQRIERAGRVVRPAREREHRRRRRRPRRPASCAAIR